MMRCPICNARTVVSELTQAPVCPKCGWAVQQVVQQRRGRDVSLGRLLGQSFLAGLFILGLYVIVFHGFETAPTRRNIAGFAVGIAVYAIVGWHLRWRIGEVGSDGALQFLISPVSRLTLVVLLYPGEIIAGVPVGLFRLLTAKRGSQGPRWEREEPS